MKRITLTLVFSLILSLFATLGFATATPNVAEVNGIPYADIATAVLNATDGGTINLLGDTTVATTIEINKNLTLNLQGHTIGVDIPTPTPDDVASAFIVKENVTVAMLNGKFLGPKDKVKNGAIVAEKNSTLTLENLSFGDFQPFAQNKGTIYTNFAKHLTLKNCIVGYKDETTGVAHGNIGLSGAGVYAFETDTTIDNCSFNYNTALKIIDDKSNYGGAVYIEGKNNGNVITTKITDSTFFSNATKGFGGAIALHRVDNATLKNLTFDKCRAIKDFTAQENWGTTGPSGGGAIYIFSGNPKNSDTALIEVDNATITNCFAGSRGGAIQAWGWQGKIVIKNSLIKKNNASYLGGGLHLFAGDLTYIVAENNIITENHSGDRGGGLTMWNRSEDTNKSNQHIVIRGGEITNNTAVMGAGIDNSARFMEPVTLKNVLITDNTARIGGGIWACPTSKTQNYVTQGLAIFGNHTQNSRDKYSSLFPIDESSADVRYEGKDTQDSFATKTTPPTETTFLTLLSRALGGYPLAWYNDANPRYKEGDPEVNPALYTHTDKTIGLKSILANEHVATVEKDAKLIIRGNVATGRGGGIASNSPINFGEEGTVSVKVEKVWAKTPHPAKVLVDLYRLNEDGTNSVKLDMGVELNETNAWKAEFHNLPTTYLDENNATKHYTYDVKEQPLAGWVGKSEVNFENDTFSIVLTNEEDLSTPTPEPTPKLTPTPPPSPSEVPSMPKTGDTFNPLWAMVLMALACATVVLVLKKRKTN